MQTIKPTIKCILKSILLIVLGSLAGALLLAVVFLIPVNSENKAETLTVLEEEGWYPATPMHKHAHSEYFHSYLPGVMDNNTDTIMISTALDENAGSPLVRAMNMYSDYLKIDYSRYWHGYVSVLRPLFYFFDYTEIRIFNGIAQLLIVFVLMHMVWQRKGLRYAMLMLTSYALLMPMALSVSFQFSWVFYIGTLGCAALLAKSEFWGEASRYIYLFVIIGMLTSYFDLLTYPLFTWGIPVIWWLLTDKTPANRWRYGERCVFSGISWAVGYLGMWGMKWVLGSLITGENVIGDAVGKVQEHSASMEGSSFTLFNRLEAAYTNWKHYEYTVYLLILLGWLVWLVVRSFRKGWHLHKNSTALLLAAATSPAWYFVLAEHTSGHHFFTYRVWSVAVLGVLGILLQATDGEKVPEKAPAGSADENSASGSVSDENEMQRKQLNQSPAEAAEESALVEKVQTKAWHSKIKIFCVWAAAGVCGIILTLTAREILGVHNGNFESTEVTISAESHLEVDFIPTFSKITEIGWMMVTTDSDGFCEVVISKDGEVLYREQIPMERYVESAYVATGVNWKLKAGEQYDMTIRLVDTTGTATTVMTLPGTLPLNELRNMVVDGQETGGQPIMGITYHILPTSRKTLLFLACSFGAAFAAILLCGAELIMGDKRKKNPASE